MQVQYVTNEKGKQVGVLLDMASYQQLVASAPADPDILGGLSQEELEALSASKLAPETQAQLDSLLQQQESRVLTDMETSHLETILAQIDQLTILKTRARYTLTTSSNTH